MPTHTKKIRNLTDPNDVLYREELGNASWRFLHQISHLYPEAPTLSQKLVMEQFIHGFFACYPCSVCREHGRTLVPKVWKKECLDSRKSFEQWVGLLHNTVSSAQQASHRFYTLDKQSTDASHPNLTISSLNTEEFGNVTWKVLHSVAETYSDNPTDQNRRDVEAFFRGLLAIFPLTADYWGDKYVNSAGVSHLNSGDLISRKSLSRWVWVNHNIYNIALGKSAIEFKSPDIGDGINDIGAFTADKLCLSRPLL